MTVLIRWMSRSYLLLIIYLFVYMLILTFFCYFFQIRSKKRRIFQSGSLPRFEGCTISAFDVLWFGRSATLLCCNKRGSSRRMELFTLYCFYFCLYWRWKQKYSVDNSTRRMQSRLLRHNKFAERPYQYSVSGLRHYRLSNSLVVRI